MIATRRAALLGGAALALPLRMPTTDMLFGPGRIREDGRKIHDIHLFRAKTQAAARNDWDLYDLVQTTPGEQAFRPLAQGGCALIPA